MGKFTNICFSLGEKQVKILWKLVEKNSFYSLSEMMREIVRDYINKTINLADSMENYLKGYRRAIGIDRTKFRKFINDELKIKAVTK